MYKSDKQAIPCDMLDCFAVTWTVEMVYEPRCEKTCLQGFRPGPTQTKLYKNRRWPEAGNFKFRKYCTICVAKIKVTAKLICPFVFALAKIRFSHDMAHIVLLHYSICCSSLTVH